MSSAVTPTDLSPTLILSDHKEPIPTMNRLQKRLRSDEGFTLIELLVVIIIIGILLAIAVPSYLAFRGKAQDTAGAADVRTAIPSAEAYFSDHNSYTGMTATFLKNTYDSGFSKAVHVSIKSASAYCLSASGQSGTNWYYSGPGGGAAGGVTSSKSQAGNC
jgi:type IV pilus assembly protein PilA